MYILELYQNNYSKDLVAFDSLFDHAIEDNLPCQSGLASFTGITLFGLA